MSCSSGKCEFDSKMWRVVVRSADEEAYGRLWAEVEMPKLLNLTTKCGNSLIESQDRLKAEIELPKQLERKETKKA